MRLGNAVRAGVRLGLVLVAVLAGSARGQQTIINVPSDALTPEGRSFVMHESQIVPREVPSWQMTHFYCYGWSKHTELTVTNYQFDDLGSPTNVTGFGFKSVYDLFKESERLEALHVKLTFGHIIPVSMQSKGVGYFTYGHFAFDVPGTDLRLLAGAAGGDRILWGENTASFIAGAEYPITKHLSFTGEWFTGNHNLSALIPGFTYHRDDVILVAGMKLANDFDPDKLGAVFEYGRFLGPRKAKATAIDPHAADAAQVAKSRERTWPIEPEGAGAGGAKRRPGLLARVIGFNGLGEDHPEDEGESEAHYGTRLPRRRGGDFLRRSLSVR
jgi:hypothetical protein